MAPRTAETAVFLWGDRYASASVTVDAAKAAAAGSGRSSDARSRRSGAAVAWNRRFPTGGPTS